MADYLDRIGAGKILIDKDPFSFDWVPPRIVGRDEELNEMATMFYGIDGHNISCKSIIIGPVGSGKTVLANTFSKKLREKLESVRDISLAHINWHQAEILHACDPNLCQLQQYASFLDWQEKSHADNGSLVPDHDCNRSSNNNSK